MKDKAELAQARSLGSVTEVTEAMIDAFVKAWHLAADDHGAMPPTRDTISALLEAALLAPASAQTAPAAQAPHPELTCERCHGPNVTWFAPNDLWNAVMGSPNGIVCPVCFIQAAEIKGMTQSAWKLAPEAQPEPYMLAPQLEGSAQAVRAPKYANVSCSQCGASFGPGDHGFSHCDQHQPPEVWIPDLIRNEYDKVPPSYSASDDWDDGANDIARKIIERLNAREDQRK